jgi:CDP-glucose 4,6-dehydratase
MEDVVTALPDAAFWRGRRILLTGHTGFKGAWTALWLAELGAEVHGFALSPTTRPSLWAALDANPLAGETLADLADENALRHAVERTRPQIVLHMAAQSIVRRGIADPLASFATNTLGTARLLAALRGSDALEAVLVVTTDKVYRPDGRRSFREEDALGGIDPYSASKAAAELVTCCFAATYLEPAGVTVATARAGNVIGGGDWAEDRLVPDVWRAAQAKRPVRLRAPGSVRPWQHVLEPIAGYLLYLEALGSGADPPRALNFGPPAGQDLSVAELAGLIGTALGLAEPWIGDEGGHPPEAAFLALDSSLARQAIGWACRLSAPDAAEWTADWYRAHAAGHSAGGLCLEQIRRYGADAS